jgi:Ca-activated chloride channel family protein
MKLCGSIVRLVGFVFLFAVTGLLGQVNPQSTAPPRSTQPAPQPEPPAGNDSGIFVFKTEAQEVVLHATVVDQERRPISGLSKTAFSISDGGVPQPITSFRTEDVPVAMGILIDNSGSMLEKREKVNDAVLNLIRSSNPNDELFVVNFNKVSYLDQDFTSDINLLQAALHHVSTSGSTALYDATVAAAVHVSNNTKEQKKVLLLITDGQDNMSQKTLQEATRQLQQENGPIVYAIGLTGEALTDAGRDALSQLASATGGAVFFPQSLQEVDAITRKIAQDIRTQYTLSYRPTNAAKTYRPLNVAAVAPSYGPLTVRTKTGYYPGQSQPR